MDLSDRRLGNQFIDGSSLTDPLEVVRGLTAVQAQDFYAATWAVGLRLRNASDADIETAMRERRIVRTWPMRGTLHFVASEDVRWILDLLAPRTLQRSAAHLKREFDVDAALVKRCRKIIESAFARQSALTRDELYRHLEAQKIATTKMRGVHVLWWLAHEQFLCYGPRKGKHGMLVLMDEWVPAAPKISRDEALARLAERYFAHHGPATIQDFAWWSGLTLTDARRGTDAAAERLVCETQGETTWWFGKDRRPRKRFPAHLLPVYDEFMIGYADRTAALDPRHAKNSKVGHGIFRAPVLIEGRIAGSWTREIRKDHVAITVAPIQPFNDTQMKAVDAAAQRYGRFLGLEARLSYGAKR